LTKYIYEVGKMLKTIEKYMVIIIAAFVIFNFYFAPRSVVAYNTRNLTSVSQTVQEDILKVAQEK
jgi:uncharacterized membrane protein (Fun14 family)